jgi:4-hydroxy-tetrahydrodipicolinate synthase
MADLCEAFHSRQIDRAIDVHYQLTPLYRGMFLETNPIPVKTALAHMGRMDLELRLPLVPMQQDNDSRLKQILQECGLI